MKSGRPTDLESTERPGAVVGFVNRSRRDTTKAGRESTELSQIGPVKKIASHDEASDHNGSINLLRNLRGYFKKFRSGRALLRRLLDTERVQALLDEVEHVARRWSHQIGKGEREAIDRMHEMKKLSFAKERAREVFPILFPESARKGKSVRTDEGQDLEEI